MNEYNIVMDVFSEYSKKAYYKEFGIFRAPSFNEALGMLWKQVAPWSNYELYSNNEMYAYFRKIFKQK